MVRTIPAKTNRVVGKLSSRARPTSSTTSSQSETWPPVAEWNERQRSAKAGTVRRLGIELRRTAENGLPASQALSVLGPETFAEFVAVKAPGKVIWCNFELARQLGFSVPLQNQLTPEFQEQLLNLSLRALPPGEDLQGREKIMMYADRYGGDGLGPALGAGRAGFLSYGNLYVKGMGFTSLFKHNDGDDFAHSHGGVHLDDCLVEAVFGEVDENLFVQGSSRVVAIIDQDKYVTPPSGRRIPIALVIRTGAQLRPGHLLIRRRSRHSQLAKFIDIAAATGQLVTRHEGSTDAEVPDIKATMLRIVDDHARTAAESFRWRMIHGALSSSNMDISGAMLDLPTQSTQPRTAPVWLLDYADSAFGSEHISRATRLAPIYRKLMRNVPEPDWPKLNIELINFRAEMTAAYNKHLQVELLNAVGLKKVVSLRIQAEHPEIARAFAELLLEMSGLKNRGPLCVARRLVEKVAVLDVFNLLGAFPKTFFANSAADHSKFIYDQLKPIYSGNRYQRAAKQVTVNALVAKFSGLYRQLMTACAEYAHEYYGDLENLRSSIAVRAAFENQPLEFLYSHRLFTELRKAIAGYKSSGDVRVIREALDQRIAISLRRVDGLLSQGGSRLLSGGGVELQMRTIEGIDYSVRAWNDEKQTRMIHVSIPIQRENSHYTTRLPGLGRLTKSQIQSLRYRFTTDGWLTVGEARGRLLHDERDGLSLSFHLPCGFPLVGRLAGSFHLGGAGDVDRSQETERFEGYVFTIPDRQELISMVKVDWPG